MKDVFQRLFAGMGKPKATPICPYVFLMYHTQGSTSGREERVLDHGGPSQAQHQTRRGGSPRSLGRFRSRKLQLQGNPRDSQVDSDEEIPVQQEGVASSKGSSGAAEDTNPLGCDGAELPSHRQQP